MRRTPFFAYLLSAALVAAVIWGLAHVVVTAERDQRLALHADQARRIATFFERNTRDIFRYGDAYLKMVRREWLRTGDIESVRSLIDDVPLDLSIASHVTIIDAEGTPLLVSGHEIRPGSTARDRGYFEHLRDHPTDHLHVSLPHRGRNSNKLVFRLVRRVDTPDGRFDGVVFVAIEAKSVTEFFSALDLGPNSSATLVGNDKRIRARSSYGRLGPGQDISGSRIWRELEASPTGLYTQTSVVDGVTRDYAYRQLSEFPLVVAIGVATDDVAAALSSYERAAYAIALLATLTIAAVTILLARESWIRRRVAQSEMRVRAVVDTVLDGIVTLDRRGVVESVSDNAASILGCRVSDLLGRPFRALAVNPDDAIWLRMFTESSGEVSTGYVEAELRRGPGGTFPAELSVGESGSGDDRVRVVTVRDISQRVEAERTILRMHEGLEERVRERTAELDSAQASLLRSERLAVLGQLTGTVAHELRNPLATVITSAKVIERRLEASDIDLSRPMQRIERNVARCENIITELLDFARARGLERQTTPINAFLDEVLDEQAMPAGTAIERRFDASTPSVSIDRERMRRVLVNLLENARDAAAEAPGASWIRVGSRVENGRIRIDLDDSGPGIPEDLIEQIHEPLFSTKPFGVGLGLPVVAAVMEEHGGGFELGNREDGGARASIWIPLTDPDDGGLDAS